MELAHRSRRLCTAGPASWFFLNDLDPSSVPAEVNRRSLLSLVPSFVFLASLLWAQSARAMSTACAAGDLPSAVAMSTFVFEARVESAWPGLQRDRSGRYGLYRSYLTSVARQWKGPSRSTIVLEPHERLEVGATYLFFARYHYWPRSGSLSLVSCAWTQRIAQAEPYLMALGPPCQERQLARHEPEPVGRHVLRLSVASIYAAIATLGNPAQSSYGWWYDSRRWPSRWWPVPFLGTRGWQLLVWTLLLVPAVLITAAGKSSRGWRRFGARAACVVDLLLLATLLVPVWYGYLGAYKLTTEPTLLDDYVQIPDLRPSRACRNVAEPVGWNRIEVDGGYSIAIPPGLVETRDSAARRARQTPGYVEVDLRDGDVFLQANYRNGRAVGWGPRRSFVCRMTVDGVPLNLVRYPRAYGPSWAVGWVRDARWYRDEVPQVHLSFHSRDPRAETTILAIAQSMRRIGLMAPQQEGELAAAWNRLLDAALLPRCAAAAHPAD